MLSSGWRLGKILSAFRTNREGNFGVVFGIALTPIVGFMGVAVDYSAGLNAQAVLQGAVDSAALAAASETSADVTTKTTVAQDTFAANLEANSVNISATPTIDFAGNYVTVSASATLSTVVLGVIGIEYFDVSASATAVAPETIGPACVLALDPDASKGVSLTGTADLVATDCAVHANAGSATALATAGSSTATADDFCAVGGYSGGGFTPDPMTGCRAVKDPLASLTAPSTVGCDYSDTTFKKGSHVALPGIYCGGITLKAHADVTFSPGVYVIKDGPLDMTSHSSITGSDVTLFLTGEDAVLDIRGGANIDITAPVTGTYAGLAIVQHAGTGIGQTSEINGGGALRIVGGVYLPDHVLDVGGNGDFGASSAYMPLIAKSFVFKGNGMVTVNADSQTAGMPSFLPMIVTGAPRLTN